jgi:hypothetical protein
MILSYLVVSRSSSAPLPLYLMFIMNLSQAMLSHLPVCLYVRVSRYHLREVFRGTVLKENIDDLYAFLSASVSEERNAAVGLDMDLSVRGPCLLRRTHVDI